MAHSPEDKAILSAALIGGSIFGAGVALGAFTLAAADRLANSPGSQGLARLGGAAEAYKPAVAEAGRALGAVGRSSAMMTSLANRSWLLHIWPRRRWVTAPATAAATALVPSDRARGELTFGFEEATAYCPGMF